MELIEIIKNILTYNINDWNEDLEKRWYDWNPP